MTAVLCVADTDQPAVKLGNLHAVAVHGTPRTLTPRGPREVSVTWQFFVAATNQPTRSGVNSMWPVSSTHALVAPFARNGGAAFGYAAAEGPLLNPQPCRASGIPTANPDLHNAPPPAANHAENGSSPHHMAWCGLSRAATLSTGPAKRKAQTSASPMDLGGTMRHNRQAG